VCGSDRRAIIRLRQIDRNLPLTLRGSRELLFVRIHFGILRPAVFVVQPSFPRYLPPLPDFNQEHAVAYGNGVFVGVGVNGTIASSPNV